MHKKWKGRELPNLNHLMSLFSNEIMSAFINGHLIIESLLVQLVDLKLKYPDDFNSFQLRFPEKVNLCQALDLIDIDMANFLLKMNSIRNLFAHRLGYSLSFDDAFNFVQSAAEGGIDFSDDTIHTDKEKSKEWYGIEGIIQEVFQNTAQDLSWIMDENGGEFQFE